MGIKYGWKQRSKLFIFGIVFIIIIISLAYFGVDKLIIASLLGVLPISLLEFRNILQKPHIICENTEIVKYPKQLYDIENGNTIQEV